METSKEKLEQGDALEKNKQWQEAYELYQELLAENPRSYDLLAKSAWCLSRLGKYDQAREVYEKLTQYQQQIARWPYMTGYQYYCQSLWKEACEWFERALDVFPRYLIVKYRLAYALTQLSGRQKQRQSEHIPLAMEHLRDCIQLYQELNEIDQQKQSGLLADVYFQLGKLESLQENWSEAEKLFNNALELRPGDINVLYQLSKAFVQDQRYEEALKILPQRFAREYYVNELRAEIYHKMGDLGKAHRVYRECLKRRARDYLYRNLAELELEENQFEEAYIAIKQALKLQSDNHKTLYTQALLFEKLGFFEKAKHSLNEAIEAKKKNFQSGYREAEIKLKEISQLEPDPQENDKWQEFIDKIEPPVKIGVVTSYHYTRGFGFIESDGMRYFFHISQLPKRDHMLIKDSTKVRFKAVKTEKGPSAIDVHIIFE